MDKKLKEALDKAINMMEAGFKLEDCLAKLSQEEAQAVLSLLQTLSFIKEQANTLPKPTAKEVNKLKLWQLLDETDLKLPKASFWSNYRQKLSLRLKQVLATSLAILVLSSGVAAAAMRTGPTSPLYPVKRAIEQIELALPKSDYNQAQLYLRLAQTRLAEMASLNKNQTNLMNEVITNLKFNLKMAKKILQEKQLNTAQAQTLADTYNKLKKQYEKLLFQFKNKKLKERKETDTEIRQTAPEKPQQQTPVLPKPTVPLPQEKEQENDTHEDLNTEKQLKEEDEEIEKETENKDLVNEEEHQQVESDKMEADENDKEE